jgi:hypothetical protein
MKNPIKYNIFVRSYRDKKAEDYSVRITIQTAPAMIPDIKAPSYWQWLVFNFREKWNR